MDTIRRDAVNAVGPARVGIDIPAYMRGFRDILGPTKLLVRHGEVTSLEGGEGSGKTTVALGALAYMFANSNRLADAPTVLVLTCKPSGEMSCSCPSSLSRNLCDRGYVADMRVPSFYTL